MFNLFRKAEKIGSDLIHDAIGEFDAIAARIQAGVQHNHESVADNKAQIEALSTENDRLLAVAARGESVAAKLRALIA